MQTYDWGLICIHLWLTVVEEIRHCISQCSRFIKQNGEHSFINLMNRLEKVFVRVLVMNLQRFVYLLWRSLVAYGDKKKQSYSYIKTKIYGLSQLILLPLHPQISTDCGFVKACHFELHFEHIRFLFWAACQPNELLSFHNFTLCEIKLLCVIPHLTLHPLYPPRLQGHGLLQRAFWLPVAHFTFLGWPSGAAPAGGPPGSTGAHGQRGEGQPALSDPRFHCRGAGRVAAGTTGKK